MTKKKAEDLKRKFMQMDKSDLVVEFEELAIEAADEDSSVDPAELDLMRQAIIDRMD